MKSKEVHIPSKSAQERAETTLSGLAISPGLGMGKAWIVGDVLKCSGDGRRIEPNEIDRELSRMIS